MFVPRTKFIPDEHHDRLQNESLRSESAAGGRNDDVNNQQEQVLETLLDGIFVLHHIVCNGTFKEGRVTILYGFIPCEPQGLKYLRIELA